LNLLVVDDVVEVVQQEVGVASAENRVPQVQLDEASLAGPKQAKEHHRAPPRGIVRLAVQLKKSLLCTPMTPRPKAAYNKKSAGADGTRNCVAECKGGKPVRKQQTHSTVGEHATTLLLKVGGVLVDNEVVSAQAKDLFGEKLVQPLVSDVVGNLRHVLGLPPSGGVDCLSPLVVRTMCGSRTGGWSLPCVMSD
jgi:hypothetical protein